MSKLANYEEMTFGQYLKHLGMGIRQFAREVGLDPSVISHYARGRFTPSAASLQKIRKATGLPEGTIIRMVENSRKERESA